MQKSYTDCYKMLGFVGGDWRWATNTTLVGGQKTAVPKPDTSLLREDRLLSVLVMGWESIEVNSFFNWKKRELFFFFGIFLAS